MDSKTQYREADRLIRRIANSRAAARLRAELREDLRARYLPPFASMDYQGRKAFIDTVARWADALGY